MATVSTNSLSSASNATIDDLYQVEGKAELIDGRIVRHMPTGELPSTVAFEIAVRLREYAKQTRTGAAYTDNVGYALRRILKSGRLSFSPDASYYDGPLPADRMRFIEGTPTLAVEVRSAGDYTAAAEREIAAKRADYFEAGTRAIWDVDPIARTITCYRCTAPAQPIVFKPGELAEAEPAVAGSKVAAADIFPS